MFKLVLKTALLKDLQQLFSTSSDVDSPFQGNDNFKSFKRIYIKF
jgi:hypothetical protein